MHNKNKMILTYFGGTFFLFAALGSTELLSDEVEVVSSAFLAAFSANFKPFTSITVTKSPACDAGRAFGC